MVRMSRSASQQSWMVVDATFAVREDRPAAGGPLQVPRSGLLALVELLVGGGLVGGGQGVVGGAEQELPVEAGLVRDGAPADPQLAVLGAPQQPEQGGGGAQLAGQLVAPLPGPVVCPGDLVVQVGEQVAADYLVAGGDLGVVADDEPLGAGAVAEADLFDLQVPGPGVVAPGTGERGPGLGGAAADPLGDDVVAAALLEVDIKATNACQPSCLSAAHVHLGPSLAGTTAWRPIGPACVGSLADLRPASRHCGPVGRAVRRRGPPDPACGPARCLGSAGCPAGRCRGWRGYRMGFPPVTAIGAPET